MALLGTWLAGYVSAKILKTILGVGLLAIAFSFLRTPEPKDVKRLDDLIEEEYGGEKAETCLNYGRRWGDSLYCLQSQWGSFLFRIGRAVHRDDIYWSGGIKWIFSLITLQGAKSGGGGFQCLCGCHHRPGCICRTFCQVCSNRRGNIEYGIEPGYLYRTGCYHWRTIEFFGFQPNFTTSFRARIGHPIYPACLINYWGSHSVMQERIFHKTIHGEQKPFNMNLINNN